MGTKTGLNGITFGDATVQNTAAVTGVSSAVAGSGISVSGSTGAVTFTNSGVTSIVAGSGISISGGTGAVTVTASGGGVTSLNGQTGAVVTTSLNSIGSIIHAAIYSTSGYLAGSTISGSSLYYATSYNQATGSQIFTQNTNASTIYCFFSELGGYCSRQQSGNVGYQPPTSNNSGGVATLSGTWRLMNVWVRAGNSQYFNCCGANLTASFYYQGLWVRVS